MWLSRILQGEGKLGPMGVECNVCSRWSREVFDACAVAKDVFMVLTCLSIKPLDLGYKGDEVMWSMACDVKNCEKASDEKGVHCQKRNIGVCKIVKKGLVGS